MQRCRDLNVAHEDETGESQIMQEGRRQCCGALFGSQGAWWAAPQTGGVENKFEVAPIILAEASMLAVGFCSATARPTGTGDSLSTSG